MQWKRELPSSERPGAAGCALQREHRCLRFGCAVLGSGRRLFPGGEEGRAVSQTAIALPEEVTD